VQDVVEIMKESLYDKFTDDYGCVDFGRSSGMSQQKEAKRFLAALQRKSEVQQKAVFEINVRAQRLERVTYDLGIVGETQFRFFVTAG
jgi:DNA helicase MCM8